MIRRKSKEIQKFTKKEVNLVEKDCVFCKNKLDIDYKNIELLSHYMSSREKILSRRISGNCAKHQRKIAQEIKRARFMNLLSYVKK
ncbi:MAG: 30S ribosomal protein S18 [Candidatus Omnitrophota bacterium]